MADEVIFDTEEKLTSLFQPDMLLCHQYFATCCTKRLEPEKSLMLAVLQDAVACFQRYVFPRNRRERTLFNETEDWICDENSDYLFSFENICEVLKFNPKCRFYGNFDISPAGSGIVVVGGCGAVLPFLHGSHPTVWRTSGDFIGILGWCVGYRIWASGQPFSGWRRLLGNGFCVWRHSTYAGCSFSRPAAVPTRILPSRSPVVLPR